MSPQTALWPQLTRRVAYAVSLDAFGLLLTALALHGMTGTDGFSAFLLAVVTTEISLMWNMVYNSFFEAWETTRPRRGRPALRRILHATLFEAGLSALTTPVLALGLDIGLIEAFLYDAALTLIFILYTWIFTWAFDRLFGLPLSAR